MGFEISVNYTYLWGRPNKTLLLLLLLLLLSSSSEAAASNT